MSDETVAPDRETPNEGFAVFWEPPIYPPEDIVARLPDGTLIRAAFLNDGRRAGFEQLLPRGTQLLVRGEPRWQPI